MKSFALSLLFITFVSIDSNAQFASNSFGSKMNFPTTAGPQGMDICDLNNDGKKDILVGNVDGNTLSVFINNSAVGVLNNSSFTNNFQLTTLGNSPALISTPDIDGDGKQDILLGYASTTGTQFSIYLNKYNGVIFDTSSFKRFDFTAGSKPEGISSGDFDNDGKIDIAIANNVSNNFYIFKNTSTPGNISLATPLIYPTGNAPDATAVGDIDNDGKVDIAVTNFGSNTITVYRNMSTSVGMNFSVVKSINTASTQNNPYWVKIVDFDNNGVKEVVCSNWGSSSVSIFSDSLTPGIGFAPRVDISLSPALYTQGTAIADYDHDGKLDLAVSMAGNNYVSVLRNVHAGGPITAASFSAQTNFTANSSPVGAISADLDNDLRPDIINTNYGSNNISVFKNRMLATEPSAQTSNFNLFVSSNGTTINFTKGNGAKRMVIVKAGNPVNALPKDTAFYIANTAYGAGSELGTGNFVVYADTGSSVLITGLNAGSIYFFSVIEFNGDGGYSNYLLNNPLTGSNIINIPFKGNDFVYKTNFSTSAGPQGMEISDLNNDGKNEILVGNVNGNMLSIFVNNALTGLINNTTFSSNFNLATLPNSPALISSPDFDGDGKKDILLGYASATGTQFSVFLNQYNGTTLDSSSFKRFDFNAGTKPEGMSSGDFDNDGKTDIAISNNVSNDLYVFKNTSTIGNISIATPLIYPLGNAPDASATGDIDNDGKIDIVVTNWGSNSITVYRNSSTTSVMSFTLVGTISAGTTQSNPYWVKIVDFNNDGLKEVVCSNWGSSSVSIFSNTNTSGITFAPRVDIVLAPALYTQGIAITDYDHDGYLDLAVSMAGNDSVTVFRNNQVNGPITTYSFSSKTNYACGAGPVGTISTDIDQDLRPDLIVTNFSAGKISILKNQILAAEPGIQTTSLNVVTNGTSVTLNFTKGNGARRIILAKENSAVNAWPRDTDFYPAYATFGLGTQIGTGNFVVYADSGSTANISGLNPNKSYYFAVLEFNGIGGYSNYLLTNPLTSNRTLGIQENATLAFHLIAYPNPLKNGTLVSFELKNPSTLKITVSDLLGREVKSTNFGKLAEGKQQLNLDETYFSNAGVYFMKVEIDNFVIIRTLIKE
ncbi:MAG: T9SS type A sorting domain-containing protein [Bacteroidia bacterium]|nr:T9SS type A sorting domain-containing protein [Bacteroidia bacterium]